MQFAAFLLAISVHESAHAWTADRFGDPTAKMLGRVTLNPIKHIDPIGTLLLPLIAMFSHLPMFGWAKPTPITPQNFKHPVFADIMTSVAGPVSNFLLASLSVLTMAMISFLPGGRDIVHGMATGELDLAHGSLLVPIVALLFEVLVINVLLGVFNLIPVPPLDGSHVLRHFLPDQIRRIYDSMGIMLLVVLFVFGGRFVFALTEPIIGFFERILLRL